MTAAGDSYYYIFKYFGRGLYFTYKTVFSEAAFRIVNRDFGGIGAERFIDTVCNNEIAVLTRHFFFNPAFVVAILERKTDKKLSLLDFSQTRQNIGIWNKIN